MESRERVIQSVSYFMIHLLVCQHFESFQDSSSVALEKRLNLSREVKSNYMGDLVKLKMALQSRQQYLLGNLWEDKNISYSILCLRAINEINKMMETRFQEPVSPTKVNHKLDNFYCPCLYDYLKY